MRQSQFWPACCTVTCARALRHGNSRLGKNRTEQGEGVFVSRSLTRTTPRETDLRYDELASGATVWGYQGNPFGEQQPTSTTGYVLNLRFPGQYYDAETGTVYNGFRNYEPALGRYLQSDPTGLAGGISTYAYVGNDPLSHTDRFGLRADTDLCAGMSAQGCMQLGEQFAPDYVTANVTIPSIFTFGYTLTRDGSLFGTAGFTFGTPKSIASGKNWGFSIAAGNLLKPCHTSADVDDFVRGWTKEFGYYDIVGGAIATNSTGTAVETGFGFGGVSGASTYSDQQGTLGHGW
ncbi:RHS repeat-associated core domain-containing protein [Dyella sp. S184]|uniref:RHS repeat-associated core domain-containing protein n=1 Tax=Dyella sp. S184 TaxID=1641862 RepID=UPI00131E04B9